LIAASGIRQALAERGGDGAGQAVVRFSAEQGKA